MVHFHPVIEVPPEPVRESVTRNQLGRVVTSFKNVAMGTKPKFKAAAVMQQGEWNLQTDKAAKDFENYLMRITNRLLTKLTKGGYAPRSALHPGKTGFDAAEDESELKKDEKALDNHLGWGQGVDRLVK